ncbi:MFS multidrug transporter [Cadophora sp. MPI-SDFR-AT-0126]|nr:MFS multidrug transporter [Leotiomycetes sp. MPI-SDFR-AT-0126]
MIKQNTTAIDGHASDKSSCVDLAIAEPFSISDEPHVRTEKSEPQVQSTDDETTADNAEYISGIKLLLVVGVVSLSMFTMLLDTSIIVTAVPKITSDFHSLGDVGWYGSAYLLTSASFQPLTGKIFQKLNSKFTYMSFLGLFEVGSLLCATAQSSNMFIVGRTIAGIGGSGLATGGLTIISACVPLEKRATYVGFMMSIGLLGTVVGPVMGGILTQYTTWRWCFYINLPMGAVVALCLLLIHIPDIRGERSTKPKHTFNSLFHDLDLTGFLIFAPTVVMFLLALQWGGVSYPWKSATVIGLFCGSAGLLVVFLAWESQKGEEAMIPLAMVRKRIVWSASLSTFFLYGSLLGQAYYLAIYFQAVRGLSPSLSGAYALPGILSQVVFAGVSGIGVSKVGFYLPFTLFGSAMNSIGTGLMSTFTPDSSTAAWVCYQIISGVGRGCAFQMPMIAVQNTLAKIEHPVSMSIMMFGQSIGGSISLAIAQAVFNTGLDDALKTHAPGVSYGEVTVAGARDFRHILPSASVRGVVLSYNEAINHVFYLIASLAAVGFVFSCGLGWKSVKKPKEDDADTAEV